MKSGEKSKWGTDLHAKANHFFDKDGYALCGRVAKGQRIMPEQKSKGRCHKCQIHHKTYKR